MAPREWQPIPLPVSDLPQTPPPGRYPEKKDREINEPEEDGDKEPTTDRDTGEPTTPRRGSIIIGGDEVDPRAWSPFKGPDEL
jgi:hypothetical protein